MSFALGQIVTTTAGREQNRLYAVVGYETEQVLIADGKCRLIEKPKRKNKHHIKMQDCVLPTQTLTHNKKLKTALRAYAETVAFSAKGG